MEEKRKQGSARDDFLEKFFKLEVAVQRLTEHEALDRPKYEGWHKELSQRIVDLEKLHLERTNGRLRDLESKPVVVHLTTEEIKKLFDDWGEIFAGRLSIKFILSVAGALGVVLTGLLTAFIIAYFKLR